MIERYKQVKKELTEHNSLINLLDCSFHSMGQALVSADIILPIYLSKFTDSKLLIGLIPLIGTLFFSLPQLIILTKPLNKLIFNKIKSPKRPLIILGICERLPWLVLGILTLFINKLMPVFMLTGFFIFYSIHIISWGCSVPLWFDFIGRTINDRIKSSFLGATLILRNVFAIIGGIVVSIVLDAFVFPLNISCNFIIAFLIMSLSLFFFSLNKNPLKEKINSETHPRTILSLFSICKDDPDFIFWIFSIVLSTSLFIVMPFLSLYAKERFNAADISGGIITTIYFFGQTIGSISGIRPYDNDNGYTKYDYKKMMLLSLVFGIVSVFIVMFAETITVYYTNFFLIGLSLSMQKLSFLAYAMDVSAKEKTSTYIAIINNIIMPLQAVFPLVASFIVKHLSYNALFLLNLFLLLLSFFVFSCGLFQEQGFRSSCLSLKQKILAYVNL